MYYVYMLCCAGSTLYTGTASDIDRRMKQHFSGGGCAAKFTRSHPPIRLEAVWSCEGKGDALRIEARIKALPRSEKLRLIDRDELSALIPDAPRCERIFDKELIGRWTRLE